MSQSMNLVEDIIFACAPLGILTAMVGAIRVGGAEWMKAIVGRARESQGVVEVELMSSTSGDVCELWNSRGVIRVLGSSPIIELYYLKKSPDVSDASREGEEVPLIELWKDVGIHDFESAKSSRPPLLASDSSSEAKPENTEPENITSNLAPNIGLNLSGRQVSYLEFMVVAVFGVLLQLGVVVFAGVGVYRSAWKQMFEKDGQPVQRHAFPSMAAGTVALVIGMFMCCHIVERSTTEATWHIQEPDGYRVMVAWLQKGGEVSDQQFESFILSRATESKNRNRMSEFVRNLLRTDTRLLIRTSHKNPKDQALYTTVAVFISLVGFVVQFVGLRGLAWHVTIAQLIATGIMTILRALIRRNLVHHPESTVIERGHELEAMAKEITGCGYWNVTTWKPQSHEDPPADESSSGDGCRLATDVMHARQRLGELSRWPSQWQKTIDSIAEAIETTMDFLCTTNRDIQLKTASGRLSDKLEWKLCVEISRESEEPTQHNRNTLSASVQLKLARKTTANGTWGSWKSARNEIEAVMGLWMHQLNQRSNARGAWRGNEQATGTTKTPRIVGSGDPEDEKLYKLWLLPQTELTTTAEPIIGNSSNSNGRERLVVVSETPLERLCGQHIFSTFMSVVVDRVMGSVAGKVRVRGGEQGVKASFGLRNTVLDELVNRLERTGLAATEDAFLSIAPLFGKLSKKFATTEAFSDLAIDISTYTAEGQYEQAESLLLWLFDAAELEISIHEGKNEWNEAGETYLLLFKTYYRVGNEDYISNAEEAMGMFCKRFLRYKTRDSALQDQLPLLETVFSNDWEQSSMLARMQKNLRRWSEIQPSAREER